MALRLACRASGSDRGSGAVVVFIEDLRMLRGPVFGKSTWEGLSVLTASEDGAVSIATSEIPANLADFEETEDKSSNGGGLAGSPED